MLLPRPLPSEALSGVFPSGCRVIPSQEFRCPPHLRRYSGFIGEPDLAADFAGAFGQVVATHAVALLFLSHSFESVLFVQRGGAWRLLVLATFDGQLRLLETAHPLIFGALSEAVFCGEYGAWSCFCGHLVLELPERLLVMARHPIVFQERGLRIHGWRAAELLIDCRTSRVAALLFEQLAPRVVGILSLDEASAAWRNRAISNFEYLLALNHYAQRSVADPARFPVAPWPERDMARPLGQLSARRASHYDETFSTTGSYFYGFHYSMPGGVFWFLLRVPPFLWGHVDLNSGFDERSRLFLSFEDAQRSAMERDPCDLKELVPQVFTTRAVFDSAVAGIAIEGLPPAADREMAVRLLTTLNSEERLELWIDLVFGFRQQGPAAEEAKNLFHPTSYPGATPETTGLDAAAFEAALMNFGQAPAQLFTSAHRPRAGRLLLGPSAILEAATDSSGHARGVAANWGRILSLGGCRALILMKPDFAVAVHGRLASMALALVVLTPSQMRVAVEVADREARFLASLVHDRGLVGAAYASGLISVLRVMWGDAPQLERLASFSTTWPVCAVGLVRSDWLVAGAGCGGMVVASAATQRRHVTLQIGLPLAVVGSDFDGSLFVIFDDCIERRDTAGDLVARTSGVSGLRAGAIVEFEQTTAAVFLVTGDAAGTIVWWSLSLEHICERQIGVGPICEVVWHRASRTLMARSARAHAVLELVADAPDSPVPLCSFCAGLRRGTCSSCHAAVCEFCSLPSGCRRCRPLAQ